MTDRRPPRFFRGAELSRLVLMAALTIGGWAAYWLWARSAREAPAPAAAQSPLPPPDDSPPFQGIRDRTPMTPRDNAAYAALLERVRTTPFAELSRRARRDVRFAQLVSQPARYRGLPIHFEGTVLRVLRQDVSGSQIYPDGVYYEAYAISPDSYNRPWVLAYEQAPPGLAGGDNLRERVSFDGYFLKLWAYEAGDRFRVAPLLIGRFPPATAGNAGSRPGLGRLGWAMWVPVVLAIYYAARVVLSARRRAFAPPRETYRRVVTDHIEPDELSAWLEGRGPDEAARDEPPGRNGGP